MQFTNAIAEALRNAVDWLQRMIVIPNLAASGAGDRLARRRGHGDLRRPGGRQLADRPAGARLVPLLRHLRLLAGLARPADHHRHLGGAGGAHRDAARGADRHPRAGQPDHHGRSSTSCRRCRPSSTCCRSCCSSASAPAPRSSRTLIYALPPIIRIAGFGIREVSKTTIEATDSAGQTYWQRLIKVQLPMARKTIIVGLNQTTLAALSMATLAAFVNGPGLGKPVLARPADQRRRHGVRARRAHRGHGGDARPDHDRGQRASREGGARPGRRPAAASHPPDRRRCGDHRRDLPLAHLQGPGGVPDVLDRRQGRRRAVSDAIDWFTDTFGGRDRRRSRTRHQRRPQPDAVAARRVAVVRSPSRRSPRSPSSSAVSAPW